MAAHNVVHLADRKQLLQPPTVPPEHQPEVSIWTAREVAHYLRVSVNHVTLMAQRGQIPGKRVGRCWRFNRRTIESLI